jgi:dTDP-4-amino-4,6-dideoxygalactose transaminase
MEIPLSKIIIDDEIKQAVLKVLSSGKFILGDETHEFEEKFAKFCNVKYSACVNSGTSALFLTLKSLGVKTGDEIIVPSLSFIASATPILMCGAKPKFVDVNSKNYTIDPIEIEKSITKKTKGIIPVHLYGHAANMNKIKKIAKNNSLFVVEDAAQAHGAKYNDKMVGSLGDAAFFSFYPSKNLTVGGDGGIVVSNNKQIIENVKMLRDHGRTEKYLHKYLGYNLRFNEIQAVIGKIMLKKLDMRNKSRQKIAKKYNSLLTDNFIKPYEEKWASHVYHMYTIQTRDRDQLKLYLKKMGINTGIHYPIPIHKQPLFKKYNKIILPVTEEIAKTTLSLPMFPTLTDKQQQIIISAVNNFKN